MKKSNKLIILYILKMLKEGSSKDNPITQTVIQKALLLIGYEVDRKTISSNINALIEYGYKITKLSGGGCYIESI